MADQTYYLHSKSRIKVHFIDKHRVLISASQPEELFFAGVLSIKSIMGSIAVMGYKLTPADSVITAFSSKENCVLKISMLEESSQNVVDKSHLRASNIPINIIHQVQSYSSLSYLILLTKSDVGYKFLDVLKHYDMPVFVKESIDDSISRCIHADFSLYEKYREHVKWYKVFDTLAEKECPKTVLCGGKGVGKSTLLKFFVNKSLGKWPEVLVIDLDPGQSEFTIMGCLSAFVVRQPLLGPNFSHLATAERSLYLGNISVSNCSDKYVHLVTNLIKHCRENHCQIPWFVNTMGFTKGLGVKLLFNILENVRPTDLVQINSSQPEDNFPDQLVSDFWKMQGYNFAVSNISNYQLHSLPSVVKLNEVLFDECRGLNSLAKRNIVTLAYFSEIFQFDKNLLNSNPRKINLSGVDVRIDEVSSQIVPTVLNRTQTLCCINANLVALCLHNADDDIMECLGYGIVRGMEENLEELFIITPLSDAQLRLVNTLCMNSSIQLPEVVYRKQANRSSTHVPYLMQTAKDSLHKKIKKSSSRIKR